MRPPAALPDSSRATDPLDADRARKVCDKASLRVGAAGIVKSGLSNNLPLTEAEIALVISALGVKIEQILSDDQ